MGQADPQKYRMLKCVICGLDSYFLTKGSSMRDLVVTTLLIVEWPPFIKSQGRDDLLSMFGNRLSIMTRRRTRECGCAQGILVLDGKWR